jgi:hypothetical protein
MANRIGGLALATAVASGCSPERPATVGTAKHLWIHVKPIPCSWELACAAQARLGAFPCIFEHGKHLSLVSNRYLYRLRAKDDGYV